jgi:DNA-binding NarL/FixJ family response regulator
VAGIVSDPVDLLACASVHQAATMAVIPKDVWPDVVLLEAGPSAGVTIRTIGHLLRKWHGTKLLVLEAPCSPALANRLVRAGAMGCLTSDDLEQVPDAIRDVLAGFLFVSESVATRAEPASGRASRALRGRKLARLAPRVASPLRYGAVRRPSRLQSVPDQVHPAARA